MSSEFPGPECQDHTDSALFGLCDDPHPSGRRAYADTKGEHRWIAVVENPHRFAVTFTAIDNCADIRRADGKMSKRCDGMLTYAVTAIFVELKQRRDKGSEWIKTAELELKQTINYFEGGYLLNEYPKKKACIANSEQPRFRSSQMERMEKFYRETGYVLRIEGTIRLVEG